MSGAVCRISTADPRNPRRNGSRTYGRSMHIAREYLPRTRDQKQLAGTKMPPAYHMTVMAFALLTRAWGGLFHLARGGGFLDASPQ
jgi:hypothetical protein